MHTSQAVAGPAAPAAVIPSIRRLTVNRFRGIETFSWHPSAGVNLILGGGDVGKTTILDAIALLLSPTNAANLSDTDYFLRKIADEFVIEAVMTLPQDGAINAQPKASWPWDWNGTEPVVPKPDDEGGTPSEAPADHFPVALRRAIELVRLGGDDRDLRLVQGSALDRLLSDKSLRSRMAKELAKTEVEGQLSPEGTAALAKLDEAFKGHSLPETLHLSITGSHGASVAALVGLTAACHGIQLPLATWGSGTRRLSALTISEQKQGEAPVTVVDEIERGLEPYRQHALMLRLQDAKSQAFVTTHSPAAIAAASKAAIWYVDHLGRIGRLDAKKIAKHRATDPNTFLSRLAIVGEGATEVGFASALLEAALGILRGSLHLW